MAWDDLSILAQGHLLSFHHYHTREDTYTNISVTCPATPRYGPTYDYERRYGFSIYQKDKNVIDVCNNMCGTILNPYAYHSCPCNKYGCEEAFRRLTEIIEGRGK